jgi:hypothetical protein
MLVPSSHRRHQRRLLRHIADRVKRDRPRRIRSRDVPPPGQLIHHSDKSAQPTALRFT